MSYWSLPLIKIVMAHLALFNTGHRYDRAHLRLHVIVRQTIVHSVELLSRQLRLELEQHHVLVGAAVVHYPDKLQVLMTGGSELEKVWCLVFGWDTQHTHHLRVYTGHILFKQVNNAFGHLNFGVTGDEINFIIKTE